MNPTQQPQVMEVHWAVAALRATLVNCNTNLAAPELLHVLSDSGAQLLIADAEFQPQVTSVLELWQQQQQQQQGACPIPTSDAAAGCNGADPALYHLRLHTVLWTDLAHASPHDIAAAAVAAASAPPGSLPDLSTYGVRCSWYHGGHAHAHTPIHVSSFTLGLLALCFLKMLLLLPSLRYCHIADSTPCICAGPWFSPSSADATGTELALLQALRAQMLRASGRTAFDPEDPYHMYYTRLVCSTVRLATWPLQTCQLTCGGAAKHSSTVSDKLNKCHLSHGAPTEHRHAAAPRAVPRACC